MNTIKTILFLVLLLTIYPLSSNAQNYYRSIQKYDIKGIAVNGTLLCKLNGFNHGFIDYGIYKDRSFYFAIQHDNAVLGNNIMILESIDFRVTNTEKGSKTNEYELVEMGKGVSNKVKATFWEAGDFVYFAFASKYGGQDMEMTYILLPQ